ncbi:Acetyl-CoA:oxalate CoA-transferase [Methylobacterium crusticola]|uniref:Acetyl-CoA:oxalate CoA-transferase n=1 Tax=Methylobacterium crusticola TaxID=1697972 RepID=A0ABQ4R3J7_9HYPH|nr:CoA transferase [Methylobacterium crusticola]GJD52143.1 Acetyl-CoA:oxalate CoA-transferase [Methylobacterium crusticola]
MSGLPLAGLRVLSVEQYGAGPFGTQHLADLGADVVKVENLTDGGDVGRHVGPHFLEPGDSHFYEAFNRNKRSIALDLKAPDGRAVLRALARDADAVFNNLRGDLPAKLGLDHASLAEVNPALVCVHLSAYGRTGSRAAWPGYDYLMQAEAGYLSVTGEPDGPPARMGLSIIDLMTGTTAAMALLAGVLAARRTGRGRDYDVSLFDVALHNLCYVGTWYLNGGTVTTRAPRSSHPSLTPSQLYRTADGWIFIMCQKEKFFRVLADLVGHPEWPDDPDFATFAARLRNRPRVNAAIDEALSHRTTAAWMAILGGKVPVAPVHDVREALENPFAHEQERIVDFAHERHGPVRGIASPVRVAGAAHPTAAAPALGQDTEALLRAAGFSAHAIGDLRARAVVR